MKTIDIKDDIGRKFRNMYLGWRKYKESDVAFADIKSRIEKGREGQWPNLCVLTCADSRVVPNLIFGEGVGGIFTIRNAGNVLSNEAKGSISYFVEHIKSDPKIILVLGHTRCGAVTAKLRGELKEGYYKSIGDLLEIGSAKNVDEAVVNNVIYQLGEVNRLVKSIGKDCFVIGGVYDIDNGNIKFYDSEGEVNLMYRGEKIIFEQ